MQVAFLLHLYQPDIQEPSVVKAIASESYLPLLKLIKNKKNFSLTLNTPLSFLHQMSKNGFDEWIEDVKKLSKLERVELSGSAAYHALLPMFNQTIIEEQVILNEYGLAYYYGSRKGLEGENAVIISDIKGFFPPEMALSSEVVYVLDQLGYEWVVADPSSFTEQVSPLVKVDNSDINFVVRNRSISNTIAFNRSSDPYEAVEMILQSKEPVVISLDGETFGHHNKEGILYLDNLIDELSQKGVSFVTVSELTQVTKSQRLDSSLFRTSSWARSEVEEAPFPLWNTNPVQEKEWELLSYLITVLYKKEYASHTEGLENIPLWDKSALEQLPDNIKNNILLHKNISSDLFWWSSGREIVPGEYLVDKNYVKRFFDYLVKDLASQVSESEMLHIESLRASITETFDNILRQNGS